MLVLNETSHQCSSGSQKGPNLVAKIYIYMRPRTGWLIMSFSVSSLAAGQKIPSLTGICVSLLDWILRWPSMSITMKSWTSLTSSLSTSSMVSTASTVCILPSCRLHVGNCTPTAEGAAQLFCLHWNPSSFHIHRKARKVDASMLLLLRKVCFLCETQPTAYYSSQLSLL